MVQKNSAFWSRIDSMTICTEKVVEYVIKI